MPLALPHRRCAASLSRRPSSPIRIHAGLADALRRFPGGVYVVWYPIKDRPGVESFKALQRTLPLPPTLAVELTIFGEERPDRLNGCGLLVLNPPWQIANELAPMVDALRDKLAVEPGACSGLEWLREEA